MSPDSVGMGGRGGLLEFMDVTVDSRTEAGINVKSKSCEKTFAGLTSRIAGH